MWRKRNSPIYDLAVFFRVAYCVSLSSHRSIEAKLQKLKCFYRSTATRNPFSPTRKCRGSSVIVAMMPMPVFAARVRLAIIAALVIGLRPWGVAIAWRMAIIGPVAVAGGAAAED